MFCVLRTTIVQEGNTEIVSFQYSIILKNDKMNDMVQDEILENKPAAPAADADPSPLKLHQKAKSTIQQNCCNF